MVIPLGGSPTNVVPFPFIMQPLTQITPFSYRDGMTYAKTLEEFGWYLTENVIPEFNTKMEEIIANFQAGIANAEAEIVGTKDAWQALFDAFMANVVAEIAALNDAAVTTMVDNPASNLSLALNKRYRTQYKTTALGNNTDETATILADAVVAAALGLQLVMDGTKTYNVTALNLPANLKLLTNGCLFKKTVNNNTAGIKTAANFTADSLNLQVVGGGSNDFGIWVADSNTDIGAITVSSLTADQPGANALFVGDTNAGNTRTNIKIRKTNITGWSSPMRVRNVTNSRFSNGTIQNFMTGLYVQDNIDVLYDKWEIKGMSPSATGSAGQNGVLIEAVIGDQTVKNLTFRDFVVENSAEHAYRIGGGMTCINVLFDRCIARKPGFKRTGVSATESTGGAGFKSLGTIGHEHKDIRYVHCTVEDGNYSGLGGVDNHSAFNMGFNQGLTIDNCTVRNNEQPISAMIGLIMFACSNVDIVNCRFYNTQQQALKFVKDNVELSPIPGLNNIRVRGGFFDNGTTSVVLTMNPTSAVFKNILVEGVVLSRGAAAVRCETATTVGADVGAYNNVIISFDYVDAPKADGDLTGNPPVTTPNSAQTLHYRGPVYGSFGNPSANGGTERNSVTGVVRWRKAGAWTTM